MINPEKRQPTEMEISLAMEDQLREIQAELKNSDKNEENRAELQAKVKSLLEDISRRARQMLQTREKRENKFDLENLRNKIVERLSGDKDINDQINSLKNEVSNYLKFFGELIPLEKQKTILAEIDDCRQISDKDILVDKILAILKPLVEFQHQNLKFYEKARRKSFAVDNGEKFIPIEGTDDILQYGMGDNRIHLHLAPMRTLSIGEKLRFIKETLPQAMRNLAVILQANPQIKLITATSYIVAANPEMFTDRIGFTKIGPMKKEYRLQYFGDCEMPVLKASMTREEFLAKYG